MRKSPNTIFDDFLQGSDGPAEYFTDAAYDAILGEHNQLAFHATGDSASANDVVQIWVMHSGDGRSWLYRGSNSTSPPDPDLLLELHTGTLYTTSWSAANRGVTRRSSSFGGPLLAFVRLRIFTHIDCHLKIDLVQREQRGLARA